MNILLPITITEAMLGAGTSIVEPAPGETAWVSGAAVPVGGLRIRTTTHRVYKATAAITAASPESLLLPEDNPTLWKDWDPTQRHAPFDLYTTTATKTTGSITFVLQPGFFNSLSIYGAQGSGVVATVKDAPGGATIFSYTGDLFEQAAGLYELLFSPLRQLTKLVLRNIPISPTAELTVTISAGTGNPVALGMLNVGDFRPLIGDSNFGGTEYGAGAEPKTYSYIKFYEDGTLEIKRRGSATDLRGSCVIPQEQADAAVSLVQQVLDVPVTCVATTAAGYDYLNVFGLLSGSAKAEGPAHARFDYEVQGMI